MVADAGANLFTCVFLVVGIVFLFSILGAMVRTGSNPADAGDTNDDSVGPGAEFWQCHHPHCAALNPPKARFCGQCGTAARPDA